VSIPATLRDAIQTATLVVSDEPPGGSSTGQPTGAVLATGKVHSL
jgi:anti-sigma-K factor RskA